MGNYETIIGLEIHAGLKTASKMFCACPNTTTQAPNTAVCPICLGHPGSLPTINQKAVEQTILLGLALGCQINLSSKFDRKNYFYPDLPKGYQISQYDQPLCRGGALLVDGRPIAVTRIHLEEDTGKLQHQDLRHSAVDFNRAGAPLLELVTEPIITSAHQAKKFCQKLQQILRYLNLSNADMEKGEMRCEANVSLQTVGQWRYNGNGVITAAANYRLNPKVELKNLNSFKALERAIEYEIERQGKLLEQKQPVLAETRGWDEKKNQTVAQRLKEGVADYRYFPEPDLPPLSFTEQQLKKIKNRLTELPQDKLNRFTAEYKLTKEAAELLTADKNLSAFFEQVISELNAWLLALKKPTQPHQRALAKLCASWIAAELLKHLKLNNQTVKQMKQITPENFAELITLLYLQKINSSAGQMILNQMYQVGGDPSDIMAKLNLRQVDNQSALIKTVKIVIKNFPQQVQQYRSGKTAVLQFLVGQAMAQTKGKANPQKIRQLLEQELQ